MSDCPAPRPYTLKGTTHPLTSQGDPYTVPLRPRQIAPRHISLPAQYEIAEWIYYQFPESPYQNYIWLPLDVNAPEVLTGSASIISTTVLGLDFSQNGYAKDYLATEPLKCAWIGSII